jgi:hypothetical protein
MTLVGRLVFKAPLIGWLIDDALNGLPDAKYYFLTNALIVFGFAVFEYGYAVIIVTALSATALYMAFLVAITASDLVESYKIEARDRAGRAVGRRSPG